MNKFSTIFAVQNKFVGLLLFVIYWSFFLEFFLLLILMAHNSLSPYRYLHHVQARDSPLKIH